MPSAVVVCSLLPSADNPKSEISTSAAYQHSSPAPLLYVLVWVLRLEIGLVDWVPRVLRGVTFPVDYPPELKCKKPVNGFRRSHSLKLEPEQ